jgi:hypothetical protein
VYCDPLQQVLQVQVRVDIVEPAGADQAVESRGGFTAGIGTGEQIVAPPQHQGADRALSGVVVHFDAPVIHEPRQCRPER